MQRIVNRDDSGSEAEGYAGFFLYDLKNKKLVKEISPYSRARAAFAEPEVYWAPDGKHVALVTEYRRGSILVIGEIANNHYNELKEPKFDWWSIYRKAAEVIGEDAPKFQFYVDQCKWENGHTLHIIKACGLMGGDIETNTTYTVGHGTWRIESVKSRVINKDSDVLDERSWFPPGPEKKAASHSPKH